jgi:hypothetical protein
LNPKPSAYEALALPIELGWHVLWKHEPCWIRTSDTLLKRQVLCLTELTALYLEQAK